MQQWLYNNGYYTLKSSVFFREKVKNITLRNIWFLEVKLCRDEETI